MVNLSVCVSPDAAHLSQNPLGHLFKEDSWATPDLLNQNLCG